MIEYNMMAEYSAFIIILVILLSFIRDFEARTLRYSLLKQMYFSTLFSIIVTIVSTHMSGRYMDAFPMPLIEFVTVLYFISIPTPVFICFLYALTLAKNNSKEREIRKTLTLFSIPYFIYIVFIFGNYFHHLCFTITPETGYVRGPLFQLTYYIAGIFMFMTFVVAIANIKNTNRGMMIMIMINLVFAMGISSIQFINPDVTTTGLAGVTGALVIHLYIQNVSKSSDHLTGLSNRMALMHILTSLANRKEEFSLYVFSVRNFKSINERQGLESGDKVLQFIASTMVKHFKRRYAFRYNGDEFAILIRRHGPSDFDRVKQFVAEFDNNLTVDGYDLTLDILYCRVDFPEFGSNVRDLISATDYSIRTLKENIGKSGFLYDTTIGRKMRERNEMIAKLKKAIEEEAFEVHYQAIYSSSHNCFSQAEALVRMRGDDGQIIFPGEFIDIAENTRLIVKITYIVLDKVCRDLRRLLDENNAKITLDSVSVNFSYLQFFQKDLVEQVCSILEKYSIPTNMINIEITERTLISDANAVGVVMKRMQEKGFVFELDDFGVDYSNMSMLLNLPVNIIKIDRSLLMAATATKKNESFFEYLISGIKSTDRISVIEGVESSDQLEFLARCGCEHIQGYVFSKPLPFEEFREFLLK